MTDQFDLTDDQREIQELARRFTADRITPHAAEWDEKHIFPRDTIKAETPEQEATNARYQEMHAALMTALGEMGLEKIPTVVCAHLRPVIASLACRALRCMHPVPLQCSPWVRHAPSHLRAKSSTTTCTWPCKRCRTTSTRAAAASHARPRASRHPRIAFPQ